MLLYTIYKLKRSPVQFIVLIYNGHWMYKHSCSEKRCFTQKANEF